MKKTHLLLIDFLYWCECRTGDLWNIIAGDRVACWFDFLPAWVYRLRKKTERAYFKQYAESIYGEPL